ncbi:MAG: FAD-binding oxidoreductase [Gaiellaceae bacterium MAG52_C11]|nr:FAD-binding oxidoreductase [Candidatus Gaiellasilicea maunaloa]
MVGAATACALAEAGAEVEVLEAAAVGGGTSAATFAVDVSRVKTPRALFDLSVASASEHGALERALPGVVWRHRAASLEWAHVDGDHSRIRERVRRLQAWAFPAEWISPERARALEPALELPGEAKEIALYRDGAWYEARVLARALLERACARGARVYEDDRVTATTTSGGRIVEVRTAAGRRIDADVIVDCAGPHAAKVAALAGATLPLRRLLGLVVTTSPAPTRLRTILAAADLNVRPEVGERVVLHSWRVDADLGGGPQWSRVATLASRLLDRARALLPGLAGAHVESARVGVRPVPPDGLPIVGFLPEVRNLYVVVAHSGVHLAPLLGRLAAEELRGRAPARLEPFRPARLLAAGDGVDVEDESVRTMLAQTSGASQERSRAG